jgi:hypothetical protein
VREGRQAWDSYAGLVDPEGNEINLYEKGSADPEVERLGVVA